jgi:D-alanyl-D-alanine carboxypeptidase/D-alanyl-D-alanine-endopeptidase (penicillin-binding protein 4)
VGWMMKKIIYLVSLMMSLKSLALSPNAITSSFKSLNSRYAIGPLNQQSFCYIQNESVEGYRTSSLQKIASVTKLLTTYFSSETMDLNKTYKTKIYLTKESMHIVGGGDPYFDAEKLLLLFDALNKLGYKVFKKVTFDKNFIFYKIDDRQVDPTIEKTRERLSEYLGVNNLKILNYKWKEFQILALREGVRLSYKVPRILSTNVQYEAENPLLNESYSMYVHESKPLFNVLKLMNLESNNLIAQNVFSEASLIKSFTDIMLDKGIEEESFKIYSGSGLPVMTNPGRLDNLATCQMILKVISLLPESLRRHDLELSDVLAVAGKDSGTLAGRFSFTPEASRAVLAKTGTLRDTSTLAGVILAGDLVPFVILNHTTLTDNARKLQDIMVSKIIQDYDGTSPIDYSKSNISIWDGEFLKHIPMSF